MNGIYPDYVGPTVEHRRVALFPDWVGILGGIIDPGSDVAFGGGVVLLPLQRGIAMVARTMGVVTHTLQKASITRDPTEDVMSKGGTGVEVTDEEPGS